jgi:ATP-binding cassette, subfamily B, heavy metal transporter
VMEAGRIVERGPHAALLAQGGRYARMWQLQHSTQHTGQDAGQETGRDGHQVA